MKNLLSVCLLVFIFSTNNNAQDFENSVLPDSLLLNESAEFTSDAEQIFAIAHSESSDHGQYYLTRISDSGTEFINDIPYPITHEFNPGESNAFLYTNTIAMELFDGDLYHLTQYDGIHIYKSDETWETLEITENTPIKAYSIFKDNEKLYLITNNGFRFFNGSTWIELEFLDIQKYSKIKKHNNFVFFNGSEGLYRFDGNTIELIIESSGLFNYEIYEDQIWFARKANNPKPLSIHDLNGIAIDLNIPVSIESPASFITIDNGLYILNQIDSLFTQNNVISNHINNLCFKVVNNQISQVQNNFSYSYPVAITANSFPLPTHHIYKISTYRNGLLTRNKNLKLIHITPSDFNNIGTILLNHNDRNLDINQVNAHYANRGQLLLDFATSSRYEVPKGSGKTSMFASGLWLTAKDENETIHCSTAKFADKGRDFYPGPLKASGPIQGTTDSTIASQFDYIWKITREDIISHQLYSQASDYDMPSDIETWPAHGNTVEGYAENLAPFIDVNENGIYEPDAGDYPDIKGDMSLYWIFNDNFGPQNEPESTPLKVEVHMQAYAYNCDTLSGLDTTINYTSFIEYRIFNRSETTYHDFSSGLWSDADVGYAYDDYIGTHVGLNSMYFYNGNDIDGTGNNDEYGENPPAQFITFLDAPFAEFGDNIDNDNDGTIDEEGEKALMSHMKYFNNGPGVIGDPTVASDYFNYLHGLWKDGRPLTFGGDGYLPTGGTEAKYMFPGDSDPMMNGTNGIDPNYNLEGGWTEANEGNPPADRRGLAVSGPFNFEPNQELKFELAFVWSRGNDGAMSSVNKGYVDVERITEMYNNGELHGCGLEDVSVNEIDALETLEVFPNPVTDIFVVKGANMDSKYEILNLKGQLLKAGTLKQEGINIKHLPEGTCILKVIEENKTKVLKIVKI